MINLYNVSNPYSRFELSMQHKSVRNVTLVPYSHLKCRTEARPIFETLTTFILFDPSPSIDIAFTSLAVTLSISVGYAYPPLLEIKDFGPPSRGGHEILHVMPHSVLPDFINGLNVLAS